MKNNKITVACTSLNFLTIRILYMGFSPTLLLCVVLYMSANVYGQAAAMPEKKYAGSTNNILPVNGFAGIVTSNQALPVNYGPISAMVRNGILTVSWMTTFETNNKEFVIEGSPNGSYWKKIGMIISSAKNGNSDKPLQYSFEKMFENIAVAGFPLALVFGLAIIFLATFPALKEKKMFPMLGLMIMLIGATTISCKKTDVQIDVNEEMIKFIRIGQIDADNAVHYSKVEKIIYK